MIGRPNWWARRGLRAIALLPLGLVYAVLAALLRWSQTAKPAPAPLICVGNLTAGGAGKTPVVQALAKLMQEAGQCPAILSRGYGRKSTTHLKVLPTHLANVVGDEPLLHAAIAPTYVGADRLDLAHMAVGEGATVLLLDDGLQHHKISKDVCLEVRNAADGLGNGWPLPAGPLRQWFGMGHGDVDAVIVVGGDADFDARIVFSRPEALAHDAPHAFCGIADPEKFRAVLKALSLHPKTFTAFADHHQFTETELDDLREKAKSSELITTEKDWVRLPPDLKAVTYGVPYAVEFNNPAAVLEWLARKLPSLTFKSI